MSLLKSLRQAHAIGFAWGGIGMYCAFTLWDTFSHVPLFAAIAGLLAILGAWSIGQHLINKL